MGPPNSNFSKWATLALTTTLTFFRGRLQQRTTPKLSAQRTNPNFCVTATRTPQRLWLATWITCLTLWCIPASDLGTVTTFARRRTSVSRARFANVPTNFGRTNAQRTKPASSLPVASAFTLSRNSPTNFTTRAKTRRFLKCPTLSSQRTCRTVPPPVCVARAL